MKPSQSWSPHSWFFSTVHKSPCQIIETQTLWGETTFRVWLPGSDSVVRIPASRLKSQESAGAGLPDHIAYVAAAARVADVSTQDMLQRFLSEHGFTVVCLNGSTGNSRRGPTSIRRWRRYS